MIDISDNEILFSEIKRGNKKSFEHLYKRYYYRLRGYAAKFMDDTEIIDDLIQECFLTLWEKREKLKPVSISSLLFTMMRNSCINYLKHKTIADEYILNQYTVSKEEERLYYIDFGFGTDHKLLYDELSEQIEQVIEYLPERCREVFILSRHKGLKNREIAEKLRISTKAVEKHIQKALTVFAIYFKTKYPVDITFLLTSIFYLFY